MSNIVYSGNLVFTDKEFPANVSYEQKGLFYDICKRFLSGDTFECGEDNLLKVSSEGDFSDYFCAKTLSKMLCCSEKKAKRFLDSFVYYGLFSVTYLGYYTVNKEYAYYRLKWSKYEQIMDIDRRFK